MEGAAADLPMSTAEFSRRMTIMIANLGFARHDEFRNFIWSIASDELVLNPSQMLYSKIDPAKFPMRGHGGLG
jgi:hypothetical protein